MPVIIAKSTFPIMAHLVGSDGEDITQADVSSITWAVYPEAGGSAVTSGTLTVSNVIFDTLQTDPIWTRDTDGFNFSHVVGPNVLTTAGTWRFEYKVTLTSGNVIRDEQVVQTKAPYSA